MASKKDKQILTDLLEMYTRINQDIRFRTWAEDPDSFDQDVFERELSDKVVTEYSGTLLPEDQVPEREQQYLAFLREMVPSVRRNYSGDRRFNSLLGGGVGAIAGGITGAVTAFIAAGFDMWILYGGVIGAITVGAAGAKALYEISSQSEKRFLTTTYEL